MDPTTNKRPRLLTSSDLCWDGAMHQFSYLKQENLERYPGQYHSDSVVVDVFYCRKCLTYRDKPLRGAKG